MKRLVSSLAAAPRACRGLAALAATGILAAALAGCASDAAAGSSSVEPLVPVNTVVAIGTGARSATPELTSLPGELTGAVEETVASGGAFDALVIDGDPRVIGGAVLASDANTESRRAEENASAASAAAQLILSAEAEEPEADVFAALEAGAADLRDLASDMPDAENHLYLVDSCLGTTGLIDYTGATGMTLASDPASAAAFIAEQADLDLTGITVHVLFAGEVASPQDELSRADVQNLKAMLEAVVTSAGGTIEFSSAQLPAAQGAGATSELPSVTSCPVSEVARFSGGTATATAAAAPAEFVFDETTDVRFEPDSATFADADAARAAIEEVAAALSQSGTAVEVVGSCASVDDAASRAELAQARAEAVAAELVAAGVPEAQIARVTGVPEGFVVDRADDGSLIEEAAAQNRAVLIRPALSKE